MNHISINKFRSVVFQLIVFGGWKFISGDNNIIELRHDDLRLFDMDSEKWIDIPENNLKIFRNRTIEHSNKLSIYDIEVLISNGLEIIKFK